MSCEKSIFRFKKFGDAYLVSTDIGTWIFLTKGEFDSFMRRSVNEIDRDLYRRLRERSFIVDTSDPDGEIEALHLKFGNFFSNPTLFIIGITRGCNLKCDYCQAKAERNSGSSYKFSEETIAKTVDFIFECTEENATIEFQGGEPLLEFSTIKRFIKAIKDRNRHIKKRIRFTLSTNLTLLNKDKLKYFSDNDVGIVGSIDGPREIHDKQRSYWNGHGSYIKATQAFERAASAGVPLRIIAVATKNSLENIEVVVDEFVERGMPEVFLNWPQRNGRALEQFYWDRIGLSSNEYFHLWKKTIEHIAKINRYRTIPISERYLDLILQKILTPYSPNFMDWRSPCGAIIGQISFDHNGNIYPCDEARGDERLVIGNVHQDTYADVMQQKLTQEIIGASLLENEICDFCVYKPFCGLCPVLNYKSSGNFQSFREFTYRCQIFTAMFDYVFQKILDGDNSVFSFKAGVENEIFL
jgi:His-Xaa-Ser system radical SAM maturase HxsB